MLLYDASFKRRESDKIQNSTAKMHLSPVFIGENPTRNVVLQDVEMHLHF